MSNNSEIKQNILEILDNIEPEELMEALDIYRKKQVEDDQPSVYNQEYLEGLKKLYNDFFRVNDFQKGQIVRWKKGLRNKKLPRESQPAIVMEVLDSPVIESGNSSASTYFQEPLDIILGINEDGNLITFYYDKRRFEPL